MKFKFNLYRRMVLLVVFIIVPVMLLFGYSNRLSVETVQYEVKKEKRDQLVYFASMLDVNVEQILNSSSSLINDPDIQLIIQGDPDESYFRYIQLAKKVEDKFLLQSSSINWHNELSAYFPQLDKLISTAGAPVYREKELQESFTYQWMYERIKVRGSWSQSFVTYRAMNYKDPMHIDKEKIILKISFSDANIRNSLQQFKDDLSGDPFLYHPEQGTITSPDGNVRLIDTIIRSSTFSSTPFEALLELEGQSYLVTSTKLEYLDWYLVNYIPMEDIVEPIRNFQVFFYCATALLLALSLLAVFMLYQSVQKPLKSLIMGLQHVKRGNFSLRLPGGKDEFGFVIARYNEMAEEIQTLIDKVYTSQLLIRDAKLKQLQSQIQPHFLYNCLYFIKNKAAIGDKESVVAMSISLGEFFRYTTRSEKDMASLEDELHFIHNYLQIQNLRMQRIEYAIEVDENMKALPLPRLIIQPLVENAIIHGIGKQTKPGTITIRCASSHTTYIISVEDSGPGLDDVQLEELNQHVKKSGSDNDSYGVWNVHQRMITQYGPEAGLSFSPSSLGGLRAVLSWPRTNG